ncbi:MAG TPA: TonB family protein [Candidatus Limnocylindrales bacterium]|nr:TonB family protein [Candidatus Limnocylindrales bacterium]
MAYVRANLFYEREQWKKPLVLSLVFHGLLAASILITSFVLRPSNTTNWGINNGDAVSATLVSASALPIPHTEESNNIVANESKGVTQTQPLPKPVETEDGVSIPGHVAKPRPTPSRPVTATNVRPPRPVPTPEDTAVPYGEGGPVSGPYGTFSAPHTQGGFSFQNADFGTRFAYYVRSVNQTVSRNWFKPDVASARRVYILFDITRGGSPTNVRIEQSSGVPALDQLAMRAVQRSEFGPLPGDYTGSKVSVEFWFDYQK